jgi:hypothetical protein
MLCVLYNREKTIEEVSFLPYTYQMTRVTYRYHLTGHEAMKLQYSYKRESERVIEKRESIHVPQGFLLNAS